MMAAGIVLGIVVIVVGIILAVAWAMRNDPVPPPRDSEGPNTSPTAEWQYGAPLSQAEPETRPAWANTIPTGPAPLDDARHTTPRGHP